MREKYRLVLFSNVNSSTKEMKFSKFHLIVISFAFFLLIGSITTIGVHFLSNYLYSFKLGLIQQERDSIRSSLEEINKDYDELVGRMDNLFQQDDQIRREIDLEPLYPSIREVGIGGSIEIPSNQSGFFFSEQELLSEVATEKLAKLNYLIELEERSYAALYIGAQEYKERIRYYPSIPPVNEGEGKITLSDRFGTRPDPLGSGGWENHRGIDIRGKIGTSVYATADGEVSEVVRTPHNELGIYVKISHSDKKYGYVTKYGHLSKIEANIRVGTIVERWQKIGEVGKTGRVTGPHLHYEISLWGKAIDPIVKNWHPEIFLPFLVEAEASNSK